MEEEESRERCNQCDFRGQGPREVFLHSASEHHFTERYECDFCQSLYSIKEQVIQHIIQKHENDPVPQQPGKKSNVKAEEGKEVYKVIKVEAPPMKAEPAVSLPKIELKPYNSDEDDEEYSDVDEDGGGDNSDYFGDREGSQPALLPPPKKEGGGGEPSLEEGEIDVEILKEGMKYICGFENCVYKTVHGDHMRRHLQTIHVKLDFRCTLCNAVSYTTQEKLDAHQLKFHTAGFSVRYDFVCVPTEENGEVVNYYHCHYCEYKSRTHWYVKTHMQTVHKDIDLNPKEHPKRKRKRHSVVGHNAPEGRRGGRANSDGSDSDYDPLGDSSSRRRRRGSDHPSFDEQPGLAALFMCGRCDYTSESCYHYKRHITSRKVHPEEVAEDPSENNGKYKCGKCSFSSITCRDILQHLLDEHSPTSQEANSEAVDEESGGANATSSKYEPKIGQPFECGRCEYTTRITNHFKRHIKNRNVHPEGESEDMSEHRNEYICGKCTFSSRKCSSILEHLSEDHKPPALSQTKTAIRRRTNKIYKCDRCPYRIGQYSHLQQHVERIHLKVRNFRCEKCGKAFAVKQSLEWHKCHLSTKKRLKNVINGVQIKKEVMSGDELEEEPKKKKKKRTPFQVKRMPVGEKAIQERNEVILDGLVGYKPTLKEGSEDYQCGECDYFSRQRYFVIRHYRKTHFDLQDLLNCKVCGEVMEDTPSLLDHMRCQHVEAYNTIVEEERASQPITRRDDGLYYCNHCDFRSDRRFGVQKHIKGLHELSAKCTYAGCGLEFLNLKLLMVHIKEEHRKKIVVEKLPEMETETTSLPEKNPEPKVVIEAPARNDGGSGQGEEEDGGDSDEWPLDPNQEEDNVFNVPLKPRSDGNKSDLEAGGGGSDSHGSEAEEVEEEEKVPLPEVPTPVRNADGLYACEHCDYSCKKGSHMKRHVLVVHLGIRRYHCKHCNRRYADHGGLKQHLITTHRIDPSNLPVYFQPREELGEYNPIKTGDEWKCSICTKTIKKRSLMLRHIKFVHLKHRPYTCGSCGSTFDKIEVFKKHVFKVHGRVELMKEESRQEKYSKPGEEQEGIFICDICPYQGTTKPMLRMHIESVHSDQKQFKCEFCPTTFSYVRSLVRHKKSLHADILAGAKDLSSNCIYCPDQFKTRAELDEHMKTAHLREKTYMCDTCGKSFSTRAAMKRHNDHVHLKLKETHLCELCGQSFANKHYVKTHKDAVHYKLRYKCDDCGKAFAGKVNLKAHRDHVHYIVRPHVCDYCGRDFARPDELKKHRDSIHLRRRFECPLCKQNFSQVQQVVAHSRKIHGQPLTRDQVRVIESDVPPDPPPRVPGSRDDDSEDRKPVIWEPEQAMEEGCPSSIPNQDHQQHPQHHVPAPPPHPQQQQQQQMPLPLPPDLQHPAHHYNPNPHSAHHPAGYAAAAAMLGQRTLPLSLPQQHQQQQQQHPSRAESTHSNSTQPEDLESIHRSPEPVQVHNDGGHLAAQQHSSRHMLSP